MCKSAGVDHQRCFSPTDSAATRTCGVCSRQPTRSGIARCSLTWSAVAALICRRGDPAKYETLQGYADDVLEIVREFGEGPAIFVGHSVSAMIGMLAELAAPEPFAAQIMIGPSPCYINEGDYVGGFSRKDIESLLEALDSNYLGWASNMAPAIMGAPGQPELREELTNSFCRTDPEIAKHFARLTFLSDVRPAVPRLATPTLIVQCDDDLIAPVSVGDYLHRTLPRSTMSIVENVGHCPHLSSPSASVAAIDAFLAAQGL